MGKRLDGITAPQTLNIWPLNCLHNGSDIVGGGDLDATCLINGPAAADPVPKEAAYTDCICETDNRRLLDKHLKANNLKLPDNHLRASCDGGFGGWGGGCGDPDPPGNPPVPIFSARWARCQHPYT